MAGVPGAQTWHCFLSSSDAASYRVMAAPLRAGLLTLCTGRGLTTGEGQLTTGRAYALDHWRRSRDVRAAGGAAGGRRADRQRRAVLLSGGLRQPRAGFQARAGLAVVAQGGRGAVRGRES